MSRSRSNFNNRISYSQNSIFSFVKELWYRLSGKVAGFLRDDVEIIYNRVQYRGDRPSKIRKAAVKAKHVYLYYLKPDDNGGLQVWSEDHFDSNGVSEADTKNWVEGRIDWLKTKENLTCSNSTGFLTEWNERSYLVFVLDSADWSFISDKNGKSDSLHFAYSNKHKRNRSFYNARNDKWCQKQVMICENYHLKGRFFPRQRRSTDSDDEYKFDLYLAATVCPKIPANNNSEIIIIDPGGKNTGPPSND